MSQPDWADQKAREILNDVERFSIDAAHGLIAARLRLIRHEGVIEGHNTTSARIDEVFARKPQRKLEVAR